MVIGGFAVIANNYVRVTEDVDFLVPDDPLNDRALDVALTGLEARCRIGRSRPATSPAASTAVCLLRDIEVFLNTR